MKCSHSFHSFIIGNISSFRVDIWRSQISKSHSMSNLNSALTEQSVTILYASLTISPFLSMDRLWRFQVLGWGHIKLHSHNISAIHKVLILKLKQCMLQYFSLEFYECWGYHKVHIITYPRLPVNSNSSM